MYLYIAWSMNSGKGHGRFGFGMGCFMFSGAPGFSQLIGWTYYVPGHFSVLINKIYNSSSMPDGEDAPARFQGKSYHVLGGITTVVVNQEVEVRLRHYEAFFINMVW
jgi:hypothetical protein